MFIMYAYNIMFVVLSTNFWKRTLQKVRKNVFKVVMAVLQLKFDRITF